MVNRCFFKSSKLFLKLGTEFQSHNYRELGRHITIVFIRYISMGTKITIKHIVSYF